IWCPVPVSRRTVPAAVMLRRVIPYRRFSKITTAWAIFDYVIDSKNTLSGRYQYERDPLYGPFPVQNALQQGNFVPGNPIQTIKWNHSAILRLTSVVSNNVVNEVHVSYQRYPISNNILTPFTNSQVAVHDLRPAT